MASPGYFACTIRMASCRLWSFFCSSPNVLNLGADLGAMADALNLLLPGPRWLYVALFAGTCVYMQLLLRYTRYVAVLKG